MKLLYRKAASKSIRKNEKLWRIFERKIVRFGNGPEGGGVADKGGWAGLHSPGSAVFRGSGVDDS